MNKKGQAAMEFLMTYGWAILAAVIAIGVLAYFGVFSPGKSLPNICTINTPLGCEEHQVNASGVRLIIRNGAGDSITASTINVTGCAEQSAVTIADGATSDLFFSCPTATGAVGSKYRADITIDYLRSGATIAQRSTGTINAEVV